MCIVIADVNPWAIVLSAIAICGTALKLIPDVLKAIREKPQTPPSLDALELRVTNQRREDIDNAKKEIIDRVHGMAGKMDLFVSQTRDTLSKQEEINKALWREIERRKSTRS